MDKCCFESSCIYSFKLHSPRLENFCCSVHIFNVSYLLIQIYFLKRNIDVLQTLEDLDKHPLMDMIDQYQRAKKSSANFRSRLKYLKSDLKRKKDSLWKTVKKEATAKVINLFYFYVLFVCIFVLLRFSNIYTHAYC